MGTIAEKIKEKEVMQWVAINDKLPPGSEWVLTGNCNDNLVDRAELTVNWKWDDGEYEIYTTHWMPLPKPPCH